MVFTFDSDIAILVGVNAAVIFQNIGFWVAKNKANEKHFHDGKYWTYNSVGAFKELFPFLTEKQVRIALQKLVDSDLIEEGSFNEFGFDRTKWYTFTKRGESLFTKDSSHLPKKANGIDQKGKSNCQKGQTNTIYKHIYKNTDICVGDESSQSKSKRFTPPTAKEVSSYCKESGYSVNAQRFVDFYASKGWMVGKNKMKDWKAAVRGWASRDKADSPSSAPQDSAWVKDAVEQYKRRGQ